MVHIELNVMATMRLHGMNIFVPVSQHVPVNSTSNLNSMHLYLILLVRRFKTKKHRQLIVFLTKKIKHI